VPGSTHAGYQKAIDMSRYTDRRPKNQDRDAVDAEDMAIRTLVKKFGVTRSTARVLAHHAGLGASEDRATCGKAA
jgi:hypothetical protein